MRKAEQQVARRSPPAADPRATLLHRREVGVLTWRAPVLMLFARAVLAVAAQAVVAVVLALRGSATPWHDAEPWLPVYGTLIDLGCLALLWELTRREGTTLFELIGFQRKRFLRDVVVGLALIPVSLLFIFGGTYVAGWLVYGAPAPPYFLGGLPLPAALYALLVWPFLWGITEQMTYNGYLLSRFQVLAGRTSVAIAVVAFAWSLQHAFMPLTFDARFMAYRLLASPPLAVFETLVYLRLRRLTPLAVAHALMDGATVLIPLIT